MSKYSPLWEHIARDERTAFILTFDEIKDILGFDIDHSFLNSKKELNSYGYTVGKISLKDKTVTFSKSE